MKIIVTCACALLMSVAFAEDALPNNASQGDKKTSVKAKGKKKESLREIFRIYDGGYVEKPGSGKGKVVIVNAQKKVPPAWMNYVIDAFNYVYHGRQKFNMEVREGKFALPKPELQGEATLFVIDDPQMPTLLSAPENRWAMVNVTRLSEGEGTKPQFFEARAKKQMTRGLAILAGAQDSAYPKCLLRCMTEPSELDVNPDCKLPVDVQKRFDKYLSGYGITPTLIKAYRKACEEGWASEPTNELQKTVWDDVHAIPTKPIKIEYNEKRDKGK